VTQDSIIVAREALDLAKDVERRVESHEDICAIRYASLEASIQAVEKKLDSSVGDIKTVLGWVGGTGFLVLVAALGFFLKAQFESNRILEEQMKALQQQQSAYEQPK
jgi:hypothetical protein